MRGRTPCRYRSAKVQYGGSDSPGDLPGRGRNRVYRVMDHFELDIIGRFYTDGSDAGDNGLYFAGFVCAASDHERRDPLQDAHLLEKYAGMESFTLGPSAVLLYSGSVEGSSYTSGVVAAADDCDND